MALSSGELALVAWQGHAQRLVTQALQGRRPWQLVIDQGYVGQRRLAQRVVAVLAQPGLNLGAELRLAAPVVVDDICAFGQFQRAVGRHRQAELLEGIRLASQGVELVHHGDGAVQSAGVFGGEADHPRID